MKKRPSKNKILFYHIIVSCLVFILAILLDKFILVNFANLQIISIATYLIAYLILAYKPIYKSIRSIARGKIFDENLLMIIASVGAFAIGEYIESVMVMILYQVGELFESYAVGKSRKSISSLMDIRPDSATIINEQNEEEVVDPSDVPVGSTIMVKVGERVPLDGIIIKGTTSLNTSALTGESLPREVSTGDAIESGTINLSQTILVQTTKAFGDSTVAKILELVENASNKKAKTENFITKFAKYYTPTVVVCALILAIVPSIITKNPLPWIYKALNFLVVSCPCALVISVPLSFFGGIGGASKRGILIKGSNCFEKLSKANIFVFDKTGTLTKGEFMVEKCITSDEKTLYEAAYLCESKSNHPIAKSIIDFLNNQNYQNNTDALTEEISGKGIMVKNEDQVWLAGNALLMEEYHIDYDKRALEEIGTIIHFSKNDTYLGYMVINDTLKETSKELIATLNKEGNKTIMLTGDNEQVARKVATSLNLTAYYAGLLPNDKVTKLEEIIQQKNSGDVVCYVGDGINDAPVLMRADIGISMGTIGSDSAIEASDVVLMYDNLEDIIDAKKIAKKTIGIARENIIFALAIKFAILVYSVFLTPYMWLAIFADVGVSVLAILNATRALHYKKQMRKEETSQEYQRNNNELTKRIH